MPTSPLWFAKAGFVFLGQLLIFGKHLPWKQPFDHQSITWSLQQLLLKRARRMCRKPLE
jgi:hypothetical protein